MDLTALCSYMDRLARWTWKRLEHARSLDARFGEVAITESLLFQLKQFGSRPGLGYQICIKQTSQQTEKHSGADFEFWLEVESERYFGYSIQAKRVDTDRLSYSSLSQSGDPALSTGAVDPEKPYQYDTLLAHAQRYRSTAMHLLYNGWSGQEDGFTTPVAFEIPPDEKVYGCAIVPTALLKIVREAGRRPTNRVNAYAGVAEPWSTLFRWPWHLGGHSDPSLDPGSLYMSAPIDTSQWFPQIEIAASEGLTERSPRAWDFQREPVPLPEYVSGSAAPSNDPTLPRYVVIIEATWEEVLEADDFAQQAEPFLGL